MPDEMEDLKREVEELVPEFGSNAYLLLAMGMKLGTMDYASLENDCVLDGPDDKKIDFFSLDFESGIAIVAQGYQSTTWTGAPPSNKAADLNTAMAWLLESDLDEITQPSVRAAAEQLRDALTQGDISRVEIYFVHNLPSSANVATELGTVQRASRGLLDRYGESEFNRIECVARQLGIEEVLEFQRMIHQTISVQDEIRLSSTIEPQLLSTPEWQAVVATIPAHEVVSLHAKYGDELTSANVRDYLGSRSTARNINQQIEQTAKEEPRNFWIFNNGITLLTNRIGDIDRENKTISLTGIAIINGAQTTGSLGQAASAGSIGDASILARVIQCNNSSLIESIIRYNNTQNPIKAWELRAIEPIQRLLQEQFRAININYQYRRTSGRRRASDVIYERLCPFLTAFYGEPIAAHKNMPEIFDTESRYRRLFDEHSNIKNLLFIYRLGNGVARAKSILKEKTISGTATEADLSRYKYFRYNVFTYIVIHVCAEVLGMLISARDIGFKKQITLSDLCLLDQEASEELMASFTNLVLGPIQMYLNDKDAYREITTTSGVDSLVTYSKEFINQVHSAHPETYSAVTDEIVVA